MGLLLHTYTYYYFYASSVVLKVSFILLTKAPRRAPSPWKVSGIADVSHTLARVYYQCLLQRVEALCNGVHLPTCHAVLIRSSLYFATLFCHWINYN